MREPSFEKFLAHLIDGEINFIVVGGLAVTLNGYVRLTEYVDILVDLENPNIGRLIESLSKFGEGYGGEMGMSLGSLKQGGDQQGDYWSVRSGSASCFSAILLGWSGGLRA